MKKYIKAQKTLHPEGRRQTKRIDLYRKLLLKKFMKKPTGQRNISQQKPDIYFSSARTCFNTQPQTIYGEARCV